MCLQIADFYVCVGKNAIPWNRGTLFKKTVRPPKARESRPENRDHGFFRALPIYMYRTSRRISLNLSFQLVLDTRIIQESNTVITLVLLKIVELETRKSQYFLFLSNLF